MSRITLEHAVHYLKVDLAFPPIRQKQRRFAPKRNKAINDEADRLLQIRAIEECGFAWISHICMDFTHLNKACPKDNYPFP